MTVAERGRMPHVRGSSEATKQAFDEALRAKKGATDEAPEDVA